MRGNGKGERVRGSKFTHFQTNDKHVLVIANRSHARNDDVLVESTRARVNGDHDAIDMAVVLRLSNESRCAEKHGLHGKEE